MNYYNKYLKYKNKYLNSKKNNIKKGGLLKENIYDTFGIILLHGRLLTDDVITTPNNIKIIISNDCGIYNFIQEPNQSKYKILESKIDNKTLLTKDEFYELINVPTNEINIGNLTYKIIEPNTRICNIIHSSDLILSGFKKIKFGEEFKAKYNVHNIISFQFILNKLGNYVTNIEDFKKIIIREDTINKNKFYVKQNLIFYQFMLYIISKYNELHKILLQFEQILTNEEIKQLLTIFLISNELYEYNFTVVEGIPKFERMPKTTINANTLIEDFSSKVSSYDHITRLGSLHKLSELEKTDSNSLSFYNFCIIIFLYVYEYNFFKESTTLIEELNNFSTKIPDGKIGYVYISSCLGVTETTSLDSVKKCLDNYYKLDSEIPLQTINMINTKLETHFNINNYLIAPAEIICTKLIPNREEFIRTINYSDYNNTIFIFFNYFYKNKLIEIIKKNSINIEQDRQIELLLTDFGITGSDIYQEFNSSIYFLIYFIIKKNKRLSIIFDKINIERLLLRLKIIDFNLKKNSGEIESEQSKSEQSKIFTELINFNKNISDIKYIIIFHSINFEYMNNILNFDMLRQEKLNSIYDLSEVIGSNVSSEGFIKINKIFTKSKNPEILQLIFLPSEDISREIKIKQNKDIEEDYAIIEENNLTVDKKSYNILFHYFLELPYNRLLGK